MLALQWRGWRGGYRSSIRIIRRAEEHTESRRAQEWKSRKAEEETDVTRFNTQSDRCVYLCRTAKKRRHRFMLPFLKQVPSLSSGLKQSHHWFRSLPPAIPETASRPVSPRRLRFALGLDRAKRVHAPTRDTPSALSVSPETGRSPGRACRSLACRRC